MLSAISLADALIRALDEYPAARSGTFRTSSFPRVFDAAAHAVESTLVDPEHFIVRAKAGDTRHAGRWPQVPYIAVMRRNVTTTTRRGVYVVLLMVADGSGYYLSLNFGTLSIGVNNEDLIETKRRAEAAYKAIPIYARLRSRRIDLAGDFETPLTRYNRAYEAAHICGRFYGRTELRDLLSADFGLMISMYEAITPALSERISTGSITYTDYEKRRDPDELPAETEPLYIPPPSFSARDPRRSKRRNTAEHATFDQGLAGRRREERDDAHEALLNQFSSWIREPINNHNQHCDLYLPPQTLIEAKTLGDDDEKQCRLALAQLLYIKYWYAEAYDVIIEPILIALFDRKPIGRYGDPLAFLRRYGVCAVWRAGVEFQFDQNFEAPPRALVAAMR